MYPEDQDEQDKMIERFLAAADANAERAYSDWEIAEGLNDLKIEVLARVRTDWPGTGYDHVLSMTCTLSEELRWLLPKWDVQLAAILQHKGVFLE